MKADELIEAVERLKVALLQLVTGKESSYTEDDYADLRKTLVRHPQVSQNLPEWLRRGSSLAEVNSRIRREAGDEGGKWERRRAIVTQELDRIVDALEGADSVSSASLEKLDLLGAGGFGEVFRCHHKFANWDVALKLLNPAFDEGRDRAVARFFQEAQILFRLQHPNIVRVFDVGLMGRRPFILMELLEGRPLSDIFRNNGGLLVEDAREMVLAIGSALAHAHDDVNVVHRDVKPGNIMRVDATGRPVLLDFGLGAFVQQEIYSRLTRTGDAPAGGAYTAPELLSDPTLLDPSNDVYSLGVIWYESVTGILPPRRNVEQRLQEVLALRPSEIQLIMRCLDDAENRPSAAELVQMLRRSA